MVAGGWPWWGFGLLAAQAGGGLAFAPLVARGLAPRLLFSIVFAGASWMIETRCTMVPLTLLLLFRRPQAAWQERVTLAAWALLSLGMAVRVFGHQPLP